MEIRNHPKRFFFGLVITIIGLVIGFSFTLMGYDKLVPGIIMTAFIIVGAYFKVSAFWMAWQDGRKLNREFERRMNRRG